MRKVHVSLTTISTRINSLHLVIESLLKQNYTNFHIHLFISREPYLLDEGIAELPENLKILEKSNENFTTYYTANTGPYRKLLPFLESDIWEQEDLIATADDDTIYPKNWLAQLVSAYETHQCVICYRGHYMANKDGKFLPYFQWMRHGIKNNPSILNLPTGKDGVLYSPSLLSSAVLDIKKAMEISPTTDDLWFKWHTAAMGTKVYCINKDYKSGTFEEASEDSGIALYDKFNRSGGNDNSLQRLIEYGSTALGLQLLTPLHYSSTNAVDNDNPTSNFSQDPLTSLDELQKILKFFCAPQRLLGLILGQKKYQQLWKDSLSLLLSNCFDIKHYQLQTDTKGSSILHYLNVGERQGLEPFKSFSADAYLSANPDVFEAGTRPLIHYVKHGQFENRKLG